MTDASLIERLKSFIENEGKTCSFDPELITPLYVYRMFGGQYTINDIEIGLIEIRKSGYL